MKGKIDATGWLYIERAGRMKVQVCPYKSNRYYSKPCGDWCPLFQDPYSYTRQDHIKGILLEICQASIFFEEFEDERESP